MVPASFFKESVHIIGGKICISFLSALIPYTLAPFSYQVIRLCSPQQYQVKLEQKRLFGDNFP